MNTIFMIEQFAVGIGFLLTFIFVIKQVVNPGNHTASDSAYLHGQGRTNPPRPE
jgi:hypothetical protein